ncbi:hypothetical protein ACFSFY_12820 [Sporosarcina siberiensis]|uniref:YrhK-like protein n=1 Tax=Sporosarcina siberiensis TaxID=1365606 RepID=A0ABW4SK94_9BACL
MGQRNSNINEKTLLGIGNIIFIFLIVFDVYLFFTKTSMVAKLLAGGSFVLLMALLILSLKKTIKPQEKFI